MTQSIELSMEIPYKHLKDFGPMESVGFCIAPYVTRYSTYQRYYAECHKDVILDNGLYEDGQASSWDTIFQAAASIQTASRDPFLIAPDVFGDAIKSHDETNAFRKEANTQGFYNIGAVVHGSSIKTMCNYYDHLIGENYEPICLSFLTPRIDLLRTLRLERNTWLHLLGMYSPFELLWMRMHICLPKRVSMDTVKPIKGAYHDLSLSDPLRHLGKWDPEWQLTRNQVNLAKANIRSLLTYLRGDLFFTPIIDRDTSAQSLGQGDGSFFKEDSNA